jgi:hypothetical protein
MGEAVLKAKFYFAPLNAHADTDCMGWVACDEVILETQAGECSLQRRHFQHPCWSELFPVRGNDGAAKIGGFFGISA